MESARIFEYAEQAELQIGFLQAPETEVATVSWTMRGTL